MPRSSHPLPPTQKTYWIWAISTSSLDRGWGSGPLDPRPAPPLLLSTGIGEKTRISRSSRLDLRVGDRLDQLTQFTTEYNFSVSRVLKSHGIFFDFSKPWKYLNPPRLSYCIFGFSDNAYILLIDNYVRLQRFSCQCLIGFIHGKMQSYPVCAYFKTKAICCTGMLKLCSLLLLR